MQKILKKIFKVYHRVFSPLLPPSCRFHPTCSCYAEEVLIRHGFFRGSMLVGARILKCHPFSRGGFDPVPSPEKISRHSQRQEKQEA